MIFGAQISASDGVYKAFERADEVGCDSFMIYTKSNRTWKAKAIVPKDVEKFNEAAAKYPNLTNNVVHAAYLINIASPEPDKREKSINALRDEIVRADTYGFTRMVLHPGSHMNAGLEAGMDLIVNGLQQVIDETPDAKVKICLELMAGQGTNIGRTFEEMAYMLNNTNRPERMGCCLDTCHIFAAGYDFRTPDLYAETMAKLEDTIGSERVLCLHLNDSKHDLDSRRDRHEHIGQGFIGLEGFRQFVNDARWKDHPAHLETPKSETDENGKEIDMDPVNLKTIRDLVE